MNLHFNKILKSKTINTHSSSLPSYLLTCSDALEEVTSVSCICTVNTLSDSCGCNLSAGLGSTTLVAGISYGWLIVLLIVESQEV